MGKTYLRYELRDSYGVVASHLSNGVFNASGRLAVVPALERVKVWDLKRGTQVATWEESDNKHEVTCIARSPSGTHFAVGYHNGSIRVYDATTHTMAVTFNGHRSAVSALAFDRSSTLLVSGARDTDVILWNVLAESGVCRLRGHKDQITALSFLYAHQTDATHIVSASKDTLVKLWDLDTQHCVETLVRHRSEVWALAVHPSQPLLVTGSADSGIRVWQINEANLQATASTAPTKGTETDERTIIQLCGNVGRKSKERVAMLSFDPTGSYLGCLTTDKTLEVFCIGDLDALWKLWQASPTGAEPAPTAKEAKAAALRQAVSHYQIIRSKVKIRSFDFKPTTGSSNHATRFQRPLSEKDRATTKGSLPDTQLLLTLHSNAVEVYQVVGTANSPEGDAKHLAPFSMYAVDLPGHRNEIRAVAISSNDELLATASHGQLKVWNLMTGTCIRTIPCGYALCCDFLPGDKHVVVGTKSGHLELFDLASATLLESIEAHTAEIWSVAIRPDRSGLATGSADKQVKFWEFELTDNAQDQGTRKEQQLTLVHTRTLEMGDSVLCVRFSPTMKHVAVALLDATIKVFFADTLNFYLSMYGHRLPVMSMDISSDGALLVTGSADKNVKIWGLDFGDCHKSLFAHQNSVMCVRFTPETHYFFTAGKDRLVKYWDGDKFHQIMKFEAHQGEVWSLAISKHGHFVVSVGQDRSIRCWERTDEPLFLEEEQEKEMDETLEASMIQEMDKANIRVDPEAPAEARIQNDETGRATRQTMETLKAGERIVEALDIAEQDRLSLETYEKCSPTFTHLTPGNVRGTIQMKGKGPMALPTPERHPILKALGHLSGNRYLLNVIEKIKASEIEDALLALPLNQVEALFRYIDQWIVNGWSVLLVCRILFFLLRVHHQQLVASRPMQAPLVAVRRHLRQHLVRQKDTLGYNLAALKHLQDLYNAEAISRFYVDGDEDANADDSLKKRKFVTA
ncbi:beta transducin [Dimargaris verticillata]|uniref:Beta transducin n=1 Tax=Dimargaris verticillata TaxID=2761393 RepID=A0A9W8B0T9_9FUNG|nr:beta transducin [Dimargaris verticillata]